MNKNAPPPPRKLTADNAVDKIEVIARDTAHATPATRRDDTAMPMTQIALDHILNNAYAADDPRAAITYTMRTDSFDALDAAYDLARRSFERLRDYLATDDELDADEVLAMATTLHAIDTYIKDESR